MTEAARRERRPIFARWYARLSPRLEAHGMADLRREALADLDGEVVEVGAGNGLNLRHYPAAVRRVVAVEPEPYLRDRAVAEAAETAVPVEVVDGTAESLPVADGAADAVVMSLVLCSVDDVAGALAEARRVLRPQGRLVFLEHVRADTRPLALAQRALDASGVWPWFGGGCHASRDTEAAIRDAGFAVERIRRFRFPDTKVPEPTAPVILGVARRA